MATEERPLFADAIKVEELDSHTYKANLHASFSIGAIPNGGYTASCMLAAAGTHLAPREQTDTLTTHVEHVNRTSPGIAINQDDVLTKQLAVFRSSQRTTYPWGHGRVVVPFQRRAHHAGYTTLCRRLFPVQPTSFLISPELRAMVESPVGDEIEETAGRRADLQKKNKERADMWFPTVVMNLENKTALPEQGAKWLNMRITSKQISNGKFDLDIIVRDADGELVALSNHVAMVLSMSRKTGKPSL